jgi:hypothetical protein
MRKVPVIVSTAVAAVFAGGIAVAATLPISDNTRPEDRPGVERPHVEDHPTGTNATVTTIDDHGVDPTPSTVPEVTTPTVPDPEVTTPTVPGADDDADEVEDRGPCGEGLETEIEDGVVVQKPHGGDRCAGEPAPTTAPTVPGPTTPTTVDDGGHHDGDDDNSGPGAGGDDHSGPGSGGDDSGSGHGGDSGGGDSGHGGRDDGPGHT